MEVYRAVRVDGRVRMNNSVRMRVRHEVRMRVQHGMQRVRMRVMRMERLTMVMPPVPADGSAPADALM